MLTHQQEVSTSAAVRVSRSGRKRAATTASDLYLCIDILGGGVTKWQSWQPWAIFQDFLGEVQDCQWHPLAALGGDISQYYTRDHISRNRHASGATPRPKRPGNRRPERPRSCQSPGRRAFGTRIAGAWTRDFAERLGTNNARRRARGSCHTDGPLARPTRPDPFVVFGPHINPPARTARLPALRDRDSGRGAGAVRPAHAGHDPRR